MLIRDSTPNSFIAELKKDPSIDVVIKFVVRTGSTQAISTISNSQTGTLTLKSPCLLANNVVIVQRSIPQVYGKKNLNFVYDFEDFTPLQTAGYSQALNFCGTLLYSAQTLMTPAAVGVTVSIPNALTS